MFVYGSSFHYYYYKHGFDEDELDYSDLEDDEDPVKTCSNRFQSIEIILHTCSMFKKSHDKMNTFDYYLARVF